MEAKDGGGAFALLVQTSVKRWNSSAEVGAWYWPVHLASPVKATPSTVLSSKRRIPPTK